MSRNFFKQKRILITGIDGFVGSALSKKLEDKGAIVFGISQKEERKRVLKTNIIDSRAVSKFIQDSHIEICFHLAGAALVESGQNNPQQTFRVNIDGTVNILEAARVYKLERVIIASTVHVYGAHKPPFLERYTPRPSRPYETSKTCADLIAQSYSETYDLPVLIPRFVNIYGPKDFNFARLIPKTVRSVLRGENPTMWGGKVIRDYLYIDDAIQAYLLLASADISQVGKNRIFNFGTGKKISVEELILKIISISNKDLKIDKIQDGRDDEINTQYVSSKRARRLLGWNSKIDLDTGLSSTVNWYKEYFNAY